MEDTPMKSPRSLANLRPPFKKGEIVPGGGRPKGSKNWTTLFREAILGDAAWNDASIKTFKAKMRKGDPQFWRMFFDNALALVDPEYVAEVRAVMHQKAGVINQQINMGTQGDIRRLTPAERDEFERLTRKYEGLSQEKVVDVPAIEVVNATPAGA
jgi:hypothetical protein